MLSSSCHWSLRSLRPSAGASTSFGPQSAETEETEVEVREVSAFRLRKAEFLSLEVRFLPKILNFQNFH